MSEMDWETSGPPFSAYPSIPRERCPYRPPPDAAGTFQYSGLLPQQVNPNMPFHPAHAPPQPFWNNISLQNMPPHEAMNNRFVQMSTPHPPGRAPEFASFDYQMGLDGHSATSGQARHSRFDGNRSQPQRSRSYHSGVQSSAEAQVVLNLGASQSSTSTTVDHGPSYNGGMAGRNGSGPSNTQENASTNLQASPGRHLPPLNTAFPGHFLGQNTGYPQPRFAHDGNARSGTQSSISSIPPQLPALPRETSWARGGADSSSRNSTHRNWFHDAFYATQNADMDSDEEQTEAQDESLRRQARLDSQATLQLLHEQMRLGGVPRRVHPNVDADSQETSLERARAARRGAAASVKFVASPAALASFESVDLKTLTGDEKNCIICYNEFGVKNPDGFVECSVRLPKCRHIFGDRCLKQWLQDSDSCPYCRDKLPAEPKKASQQDDVRRLIAQTRNYGMEPWYVAEMTRFQNDQASHTTASEREQQYRQLMQQRMAEHESSDDVLVRMRRREELDWSTSFNQSSIGIPSRSMPDNDGRRRYRGRHSVSRTAIQAASRTNGPNSTRLARNVNVQSGPMRTPIHSITSSFEESSTSQRRSVTPHPTITGIPTWSSPPQLPSTTSGRPSSLPTERSPLGEATEIRPNPLGTRTPSGSSTTSNPLIDTPWQESPHTVNNPLVGWRLPITNNGRPASASFINDVPQSRLQQLHEDLDRLDVHIHNHRLPPYMLAPNDNDVETHMGSLNRR